eukprot:4005370-Alexandrium_andersonii.AAC.1
MSAPSQSAFKLKNDVDYLRQFKVSTTSEDLSVSVVERLVGEAAPLPTSLIDQFKIVRSLLPKEPKEK